ARETFPSAILPPGGVEIAAESETIQGLLMPQVARQAQVERLPMADILNVELRTQTGKRRNWRMRCQGKLPGIVYGHGEEPVMVSVPADQLRATLRHGHKVVDLQGAATGQALLQDVQWDAFQQHLVHVDLLRVDANERVTVEVPLLLKGEAPGEHEGGVVVHVVHHVEIETSPIHIPEALHININQLKLHGALRLSDIYDMPEGAVLVEEPETVAVHCEEPAAETEESELAATGAEPELIGRKSDEEGEAAQE
ncbi:MAG TPA: 50S ribosomal protein L25, partial [Lacipirellulaceae bacterium]|nr:50S ribosomal protein L25 [Lacipirellulaceae bacterium]